MSLSMSRSLFAFSRLSLVLLTCALAAQPRPATAAAPAEIGKFGYWTTYSLSEGGHNVCYMSITAKAPAAKGAAAKKVRRGNVVLMITHRPGESTTDVVSYTAGTKFKPATDANVNVGNKQFNLFTQNDTAWSRDTATDHALTLAIRGASSLAISGTSAQGTPVADTVALKGADAAYAAISKACGVSVAALPKAQPVAAKKESTKTTKAKPAPAKTVAKPTAPTHPKAPSAKKAAPKNDIPSSADLKKLLSQ